MATYRRSMSGLEAEETERWGRDTARERYGTPRHENGAAPPPDRSEPQKLGDRNNLRAPDYPRDASNNWVRGKNESAESRPSFMHGRKGGK
jgi:hypothetical protein